MKTEKFKGFTPLEKTADSNLRSLLPKEESGLRLPLSLRGSLTGFTVVELLTVIAIIAILIGILMPALSQVKKLAKETREKAQITSIEVAVILYKNDFGEYPPSHGCTATEPFYYGYCGAQTLAEAMFGQDLLGFHPDSIYDADADKTGGLYSDPDEDNLRKRKDPYLDRTNISVFTPYQIFNRNTSPDLEPDKYVICDVFTAVNRSITLPDNSVKSFKIGTPVLYFRANTAAMEIDDTNPADSIYNFYDNQLLVGQGRVADDKPHEGFLAADNTCGPFYTYITDPFTSTFSGSNPRIRPARPDSFLLISAGSDGFYGTRDDICNFTPNIE